MNIAKLIMQGEFSPEMLRYCFHTGAGHQQRRQATSDFGQQGNLTNQAQGTLSQFEGPVQNSPFYKALLSTGIQDTSDAYQTAQSNLTAKANNAGFGYSSPTSTGANTQLQAQETSDLAKVPQTAMLETAPLELQAAGDTAGMGMGYGAQGSDLLNANAGNTTGLYKQLMQTGGQIAAAALGRKG